MNEINTLIDRVGRLAVLYGGRSSERSVSLESGAAVIKAFSQKGFDVVPIDIGDNPLQQILHAKPDAAFIALHGPGGEDGKMQALLEFLSIPYTGSGVAASALCMDKLRTKQLWQGVGLPTPAYHLLTPETDWQRAMSLARELIVKPGGEGSSYGVARVADADALQQAYEAAAKFDNTVLAEAYISGAEYTVAIIGERALPAIQLKTPRGFYDFTAKYEADDTTYLCPCGLNEKEELGLQALCVQAFKAVGARGWGRVDVMEQDGQFYLLEVNTVPGMTSHSLVPMAAKASGLNFDDLVIEILKLAIDK